LELPHHHGDAQAIDAGQGHGVELGDGGLHFFEVGVAAEGGAALADVAAEGRDGEVGALEDGLAGEEEIGDAGVGGDLAGGDLVEGAREGGAAHGAEEVLEEDDERDEDEGSDDRGPLGAGVEALFSIVDAGEETHGADPLSWPVLEGRPRISPSRGFGMERGRGGLNADRRGLHVDSTHTNAPRPFQAPCCTPCRGRGSSCAAAGADQ
jgi:hypothetical protein